MHPWNKAELQILQDFVLVISFSKRIVSNSDRELAVISFIFPAIGHSKLTVNTSWLKFCTLSILFWQIYSSLSFDGYSHIIYSGKFQNKISKVILHKKSICRGLCWQIFSEIDLCKQKHCFLAHHTKVEPEKGWPTQIPTEHFPQSTS
jgi:hypothetical protein